MSAGPGAAAPRAAGRAHGADGCPPPCRAPSWRAAAWRCSSNTRPTPRRRPGSARRTLRGGTFLISQAAERDARWAPPRALPDPQSSRRRCGARGRTPGFGAALLPQPRVPSPRSGRPALIPPPRRSYLVPPVWPCLVAAARLRCPGATGRCRAARYPRAQPFLQEWEPAVGFLIKARADRALRGSFPRPGALPVMGDPGAGRRAAWGARCPPGHPAVGVP